MNCVRFQIVETEFCFLTDSKPVIVLVSSFLRQLEKIDDKKMVSEFQRNHAKLILKLNYRGRGRFEMISINISEKNKLVIVLLIDGSSDMHIFTSKSQICSSQFDFIVYTTCLLVFLIYVCI